MVSATGCTVNLQCRYHFSNSLWKHAITTSDNNSEIKVWSCATWECLQTVVFKSNIQTELHFKAEIDPTSSYLVLTDTISRGLYVLQIMQSIGENNKPENGNKSGDEEHNSSASTTTSETKTTAYIKSIAEFALSSPILSFGIIDATVRKFKCAYNDHYLLDELDDYEDDSLSRYCVVIHLYLVQPKSVQECHVLYQPTITANAAIGSSLSALAESSPSNSEGLVGSISNYSSPKEKDKTLLDGAQPVQPAQPSTQQLLDVIMNKSPAPGKVDNILNQSANTSAKSTSINLMTPDSFHSHGNIFN